MLAEKRDVAGTVVAVTGASSGIGRAVARELASLGAHLVVGARRKDRLDDLVAETGTGAIACQVDVRNPSDLGSMVDAAVGAFGGLDSIVIAAGIGSYGSIMDYSDAQLATMMDTNLAGTVWAVRAAVPAMERRGGGDIVIISSVAGLRGGANEAVYSATKFAQVGLAGSLDRELRERSIRVSVVCPAAVATEFAIGYGRQDGMAAMDGFLRAEDISHAVCTILAQPRRMRTQQWSMWSMSEPS